MGHKMHLCNIFKVKYKPHVNGRVKVKIKIQIIF